jgi:uncharacterized membrane protein YvbJ
MFCPFCGRQTKDNALFCEFCRKALPQKTSPLPVIQPIPQANPRPQKAHAPKARISNTAKKAIITGILIVGLVIVVLLIYYPGVFSWKW